MRFARIVTLVASSSVGLVAPAVLRAQHDVGAPPVGAVVLTGAAVRADLAILRTQFLARDRSFSAAHRDEAEAGVSRLESAADTVSLLYLELEVARIVALADNGHTAVWAGRRGARFDRIALRFTTFGEDFYVLRAREQDADLLGARVVAIDGHAIAEVRAAARTLSGGTAAWRDRTVPYVIESPQQLHALGVAKGADAATYRFALADGRLVDRRISAGEPDPSAAHMGPNLWMFPSVTPPGAGKWTSLLAEARAPWSLRDPGVPFRWRDAPELDGVVIELRQTIDAPARRISDFFRAMDSVITARHPRNVVLDLRMNGGGDLNTSRAFVKALPGKVPGRIFALTGPGTFSAAISTLGYLKQAAPDRVTIVGEHVGDRIEFWAEGGPVTLPNSGILVGVATERHDYRTGCEPYTDCHGAVVRNPIRVPTFDPEIAAPWDIASYRAGRDPAMDAVRAALGR
jgi:hypothetical protein